MQVCTSLPTDNYASTQPLSFLQARCPSCCPTNSVKALKARALKARALKARHIILHYENLLAIIAWIDWIFSTGQMTFAFIALTLLVGWQEGQPACKNWVVRCWRGYLFGARCRLAYGPADATATHYLLLQYNPDWFYLSGTGSPG